MTFAQLGIAFRLRRWQENAVEQVVKQVESGGRSVCLVAPPGAGKTVCSLAVALEIGRFVEIRVPTTALVEQWNERIRRVVHSLDEKAVDVERFFRVSTYAAKRPAAPNSLLILDEAHHLTASWGEYIEAQDDGSQIRFGLTATPPFDSTEWDRFLELFGDDFVEISAPPLVRDRQLCPFLDLVWPVVVAPDDLPSLQTVSRDLQLLEERYGVEYRAWQDQQLRERLWVLTEEYFAENKGLLVSLCRLRNAAGRALPTDLYPDREFVDPPTLIDRAYALWAFGEEASKTDLDPALKEIGFQIRKAGPVLSSDLAWKALSGSGARVRGTIELLKIEARVRGDGLRALIVCERDVEGDVLSARQVLKALVSNPETDRLDPILVTGSVFWVDDDLWARIRSRLPPMPWVEKDGHHELSIEGWPTAKRVAFATQLLTDGLTRCLVGTRHLLGEGWDCPAVSCVIDLTGISTSVTVNQIRGRALRPDPADPSKVASLWDVISLSPDIADGDRMLQKLVQRHEKTFGITDQGVICSGVARIDPILNGSAQQVSRDVERLQQHMTQKLKDASFCVENWAVGKNYLDARRWKVQTSSKTASQRSILPKEERPEPTHVAEETSLIKIQIRFEEKKRQGRMRLLRNLLLFAGIGFWLRLDPLLCVVFLLVIGCIGILLQPKSIDFQKAETEAIVRALYEALKKEELIDGDLHDHDGYFWVDSEHRGERFARSVQTVLGPVRYPRYLLVEESGRVFSIPEDLSVRRDTADRFADSWSRHVSPCSAVYARSAKGKEMLHNIWKRKQVAEGLPEIVEAWE